MIRSRRIIVYLLLPLGICLSACTTQNEPAALLKPNYFDLETLLQKNISWLTDTKAAVTKTAAAGAAKTETETLQQVNWTRELELFTQAAINRPAWRDAFTTDTLAQPDGNRLVHYTRKPGHDAPVEFMEVQLTPANQPKTIQARIGSNNMLFFTQKDLQLHLNQNQQLQHYQVSGIQKMLLSDTMRYQLQGTVLPATK